VEISLCYDTDDIAEPLCKERGFNENSCGRLKSAIEWRRDQLRRRLRPAYIQVRIPSTRDAWQVSRRLPSALRSL
jgi:hypothetical protein